MPMEPKILTMSENRIFLTETKPRREVSTSCETENKTRREIKQFLNVLQSKSIHSEREVGRRTVGRIDRQTDRRTDRQSLS